MRILVADNDMGILESLRDSLATFYEVDTATSGSQAIRKFRANKYAGIVMDVEFGPGMSGVEAADTIRRENVTIPIVVISAEDYSDDLRNRVISLGATFVEKPIDVGRIVELIGKSPKSEADCSP